MRAGTLRMGRHSHKHPRARAWGSDLDPSDTITYPAVGRGASRRRVNAMINSPQATGAQT